MTPPAEVGGLERLRGEPDFSLVLGGPVTRDMLLRLTAATGAPLLPLALTMMPLEELLKPSSSRWAGP